MSAQNEMSLLLWNAWSIFLWDGPKILRRDYSIRPISCKTFLFGHMFLEVKKSREKYKRDGKVRDI